MELHVFNAPEVSECLSDFEPLEGKSSKLHRVAMVERVRHSCVLISTRVTLSSIFESSKTSKLTIVHHTDVNCDKRFTRPNRQIVLLLQFCISVALLFCQHINVEDINATKLKLSGVSLLWLCSSEKDMRGSSGIFEDEIRAPKVQHPDYTTKILDPTRQKRKER